MQLTTLPQHHDGESFAEVLAAAQQGAGWAFERLYRNQAPFVESFLRARRASDPDEMVNETFRRVFLSIHNFSGDERHFRAYAFTVARNLLIDEHRKRGRRIDPVLRAEPTDQSDGVDIELPVDEVVAPGRAMQLVNELAPDQRDVILLRIIGDLSIEDTAQALGKRPGAVRALQFRALRTLKRRLQSPAA